MVFKKLRKVLKARRSSRDDRGSELVEFIGFMPWILIVGLIIWQFMVFGHAMLTTGNAARQGARAAAAHGGAGAAVNQAKGTYDCEISVAPCWRPGDPVAVTVRCKVPIIGIPFVSIPEIRTTSTAIARCEPMQ
jgi:hypothetical protein